MVHDDVSISVLLIEDNVGDATLLKLALAEIDSTIKVNWIPTAEAGLRHIDECTAAVDLIVLDVNLPRMSGADFLRALQQRPTSSRFPVMILSSADPTLDLHDVYHDDLGAYIVKPSDLNGYRQIARQVVGWCTSAGDKPG